KELEHENKRLRQMESALYNTESEYKSTLDDLQIGVVVHHANTTILLSNPAACKAFGLTVDQMTGKDARDPRWKLVYEDLSEMPYEAFPVNKVLSTQNPLYNYVIGVIKPEQEFITWLSVHAIPIFSDTGEIKKIITNFIDITQQKQDEEEWEKMQKQLILTQKMESIGRLAGGIAHDYNNMLSVIVGYTEMALVKLESTHKHFSYFYEIHQAAKRSAELTRQLLAFARKQTISPEVLNLNNSVESILKMLQRLLGEDIDLAWLPCIDLWPIKVDQSNLDQLVINLCVNARDAIENKGKITIETGNVSFDEKYCKEHTGCIPGDFVMLSISDNGQGMDKETIKKIFEPFYTTKGMGRGTGLGLATVYGIVKQNNGFIDVYAEPEIGTNFKVYFPCYKSKYFRKYKKIYPSKPLPSGNETVLVVEDESAILEMASAMLQNLGYKVLTASTPSEAIQLAKRYENIHLLLTDVVMSEMNGRELARNIMTHFPSLKVLFMSGYTSNIIANHGVLSDDMSFIQKPFNLRILSEKIREVLTS
ncbi:MAG: ATP-binding protein, partial [Thermodesulfobacteriota bacterium]|nr:ATP-binding protein [Thermodesulfobacteriota bacterium]